MCGIVAYVGPRDAQPILLDALSRLEYRGYDSAGLAILNGKGVEVRKKSGRIQELASVCQKKPVKGQIGISHTRWATHGGATDANAHPHLDASGRLALVHNGVVENYLELKAKLVANGHKFASETDTEVLAHLLGDSFAASKAKGEDKLVDAVRSAIKQVQGTLGIAVIHTDLPGLVVGARRGSPLVIGIGEGENFLASDTQALAPYTNRVVILQDQEVVALKAERYDIASPLGIRSNIKIEEVENSITASDKGQYPHYMLKEIFEQASSIQNAFRGRLDLDEATAKLGGLNLSTTELRAVERVSVLGCGTALHAGMVGKYLIERLAKIPVETHYASEFRYGDSPTSPHTLFFAVSQSGETADTLGALREAQRRGFPCLGICNHVSSTIARESNGGVYMHSGPEIGVAATKSFTSQVAIFTLLGLLLGRLHSLSASNGREILQAIESLPEKIEQALGYSEEIKEVAKQYAETKSMLFLGRLANFPIALEGALKMKEITYIHAEGYPSAELKHGVIALIDKETPTVLIATRDGVYDKNLGSLQEIKARDGRVIAVAHETDTKIKDLANAVLPVPETHQLIQPLLNVIPLQLLSYHTAVALGRDVDKPRNLAKSVTVE
ncbi:MAG: glutamine--fructose-6-phosphate transaminase (isomerizing) [Verrucomicrobia bacterium]|nr:glutamine--fructose-6-phosphate transaminase (isomerizing) [Verrucomicrobiota bacterium]